MILVVAVFSKLGFILHPVKSVLKPVQALIFLGFVLDSVNTTVSLTQEKPQGIMEKCNKMMELTELSIWEPASFIRLLVSSFPGVLYGPLFYRHLEMDKTTPASRASRPLVKGKKIGHKVEGATSTQKFVGLARK